jgi:hypothetical protein
MIAFSAEEMCACEKKGSTRIASERTPADESLGCLSGTYLQAYVEDESTALRW